MTIFKLPDLGEGLPDAEISAWHVSVGQKIEIDQILVSMETAKALVEVPSPFRGRVLKLFGNPGESIKTAAPLIEIEQEFEVSESKVLESDKGTVAGRLEESKTILQEEPTIFTVNNNIRAKATPAVRALAKRLKVDLDSIQATDPSGVISSWEVEIAAKDQQPMGSYENLTGVRRRMSEVMQHANTQVVPVTVMEDAKLFRWDQKQDITVHIIQAMVKACQQEPALNVWYDPKAQSRRLMNSINLGIAMDTKDGLFVPVIHGAEKLEATALRLKLDELKLAVEHRKILPEHLQGSTITLSNFGKFRGRYATPIIIPPMVAILAAGRVRQEVVVIEDKPSVCQVLAIALTVDHRVVTGGEATRFLGVIVEYLENL